MIGSAEGSFTELALEGPVTGVLPLVAGQLVRSARFKHLLVDFNIHIELFFSKIKM